MNTDNVKAWLGKYFDTSAQDIDEMLKDELAMSYLLIWPIFEQKIFDGFMQRSKISDVAEKYAPYAAEMNIEEAAQHFHKRYQNKANYRHLRHDEKYREMDQILTKKYAELGDTEKLQMMLYTAYRFRNNIFHGNKGILSWSQFGEQIGFCLDFMMSMLDCADQYFPHEGVNE